MKHARFLLLGLSVCLLSGCDAVREIRKDLGFEFSKFSPARSSSSEEYLMIADCPRVEVVEELSVLNDFVGKKDDLVSRVRLSQLDTTCQYTNRSVTVDMKLAFEGQLGAKGRTAAGGGSPFFSYPFFIAVAKGRDEILAKEIFSAGVTYKAGKDMETYTESLRQIIPVTSRSKGKKYKIMVGFQLTPGQLAYNRMVLAEQRAREEAEEERRIEEERRARREESLEFQRPKYVEPYEEQGAYDEAAPYPAPSPQMRTYRLSDDEKPLNIVPGH